MHWRSCDAPAVADNKVGAAAAFAILDSLKHNSSIEDFILSGRLLRCRSVPLVGCVGGGRGGQSVCLATFEAVI